MQIFYAGDNGKVVEENIHLDVQKEMRLNQEKYKEVVLESCV